MINHFETIQASLELQRHKGQVMEKEIKRRQSNESFLKRMLLETSMRSPTSEVGESLSLLNESVSMFEK